jgi:hypothetical protein
MVESMWLVVDRLKQVVREQTSFRSWDLRDKGNSGPGRMVHNTSYIGRIVTGSQPKQKVSKIVFQSMS